MVNQSERVKFTGANIDQILSFVYNNHSGYKLEISNLHPAKLTLHMYGYSVILQEGEFLIQDNDGTYSVSL